MENVQHLDQNNANAAPGQPNEVAPMDANQPAMPGTLIGYQVSVIPVENLTVDFLRNHPEVFLGIANMFTTTIPTGNLIRTTNLELAEIRRDDNQFIVSAQMRPHGPVVGNPTIRVVLLATSRGCSYFTVLRTEANARTVGMFPRFELVGGYYVSNSSRVRQEPLAIILDALLESFPANFPFTDFAPIFLTADTSLLAALAEIADGQAVAALIRQHWAHPMDMAIVDQHVHGLNLTRVNQTKLRGLLARLSMAGNAAIPLTARFGLLAAYTAEPDRTFAQIFAYAQGLRLQLPITGAPRGQLNRVESVQRALIRDTDRVLFNTRSASLNQLRAFLSDREDFYRIADENAEPVRPMRGSALIEVPGVTLRNTLVAIRAAIAPAARAPQQEAENLDFAL